MGGTERRAGRKDFFAWPASFLRPLFPAALSYNRARDNEGGRRRDDSLCGQRVRSQRPDGLPAAALYRAAGGGALAPQALRPGGHLRRGLRRGSVPAGVRLSGIAAGKDRGGGGPLRDRLRRGGAAPPSDAAAVCRILCHGRVRAGAGAAGGQCRAGGPGRVLHRRLRQSAADRRRGGVSGADGGVPGGGPARPGGRAGERSGVYQWPDRRSDGPAGHGQRPAGPGDRHGGVGDIPGGPGRRPAAPGPAPLDAGPAAVSAGSAGAAAAGGAAASVPPGAIPGGGCAGWTAAGGAQRLDGSCGGSVSGADGGSVPHVPGAGIRRSVGRSGQKESQA